MGRKDTTARVPVRGVPPEAWDRLSRQYGRQIWLERAAVGAALELAAPASTDRLIDIGTGTGEVLRQLAQRASRPRVVVGVDQSAGMLARIPHLPAGWGVLQEDASELPFAAGSFDVALVSYVLHLLPPGVLTPVLAELARVLLPGGRLVSVTPIIPQRGWPRLVAALCDEFAQLAPIALGGLRALDPGPALERAGFTLERGRIVHRGYPSLCLLARLPPRLAAADRG